MPFVKVGVRHQITIPTEVRQKAGIEAGDLLDVQVRGRTLVLVPKQVVSKVPVPKLTPKEQKLLAMAKKKIQAISEGVPTADGLRKKEADVAARAGLIDPEQKWWWLERWQREERIAEVKGRVAGASSAVKGEKAAAGTGGPDPVPPHDAPPGAKDHSVRP